MAFKDEARFYTIDGRELPSVTTALQVINKPALGPWYAKEERRVFETAMLEVATKYHTITGEQLIETVIATVAQVKAGDKAKQAAGVIGTAAHAYIEWLTRRLLGEDAGPEPVIPEVAHLAVMAWQDWAKAVDFTPLMTERVVYCHSCGYAGTMDFLAKVEGVVTLGDYKTGRAIYPESFLQNQAYRHALLKTEGVASQQGLILRLPKTLEDPAFEAMIVPETSQADFLAALKLWQWQRRMQGKPTGTPMRASRARVKVGVDPKTGEW